jgi:hypothetical protein
MKSNYKAEMIRPKVIMDAIKCLKEIHPAYFGINIRELDPDSDPLGIEKMLSDCDSDSESVISEVKITEIKTKDGSSETVEADSKEENNDPGELIYSYLTIISFHSLQIS